MQNKYTEEQIKENREKWHAEWVARKKATLKNALDGIAKEDQENVIKLAQGVVYEKVECLMDGEFDWSDDIERWIEEDYLEDLPKNIDVESVSELAENLWRHADVESALERSMDESIEEWSQE